MKRFVASFLDSLILSLLGVFITGVSGLLASNAWIMLWSIIAFLLPCLYYIWPYATNGQTPGKGLRHIRVVSIDGGPLNWRQGVLRWFGYLISGLALGLGYLWALGDKNGQAWHDKIAGTMVVADGLPIAPAPLSREDARRQRRRWQLVLGLPTSLLLIVLAFFLLRGFQGAVAEVRAMQPWPSPSHDPQAVLPADLSHLGLGAPLIRNARTGDTFWTEGTYSRGAVAEYAVAGEPILWIAALRYDDSAAALAEFNGMNAWAEQNCGLHTWAQLFGSGLIQCTFTDAYNKTFLNDNWIVDVVAANAASPTPQQFVDQVRDAIAQHWQTFE